ncbi:MAG: hypothetical protein ACI4S9_03000, partial [Christensenellales bacterium]
MEDIIVLLDELEEEITKARSAVFSRKILVDGDKILQILTALKAGLPTVIREAKYITEHKEEIERNSLAESKKIINEAEMRAEQIVSETELLKRA